jgi:hypothetical protein
MSISRPAYIPTSIHVTIVIVVINSWAVNFVMWQNTTPHIFFYIESRACISIQTLCLSYKLHVPLNFKIHSVVHITQTHMKEIIK